MPERRDPATTYANHLASQPAVVAGLLARRAEAVAGLAALPDRPWSRVVFVGSGTSRFAGCGALAVAGAGRLRAAAAEGALKVLEVAKLPVLDYELEESLHGPFNAFGADTGLVLLAAADASPARTRAFPALPFAPLAPLVAVLPLQVLALQLARARGVDPDRTRYPELYAIFRTKAGQGEEGSPDRPPG